MLRVKNDGCEVALAATPTRRKPAEAHTASMTELRAKAYPKVRRLQASQPHLLTAWASLQKDLPYQGQCFLEHCCNIQRRTGQHHLSHLPSPLQSLQRTEPSVPRPPQQCPVPRDGSCKKDGEVMGTAVQSSPKKGASSPRVTGKVTATGQRFKGRAGL